MGKFDNMLYNMLIFQHKDLSSLTCRTAVQSEPKTFRFSSQKRKEGFVLYDRIYIYILY